MANVMSNSRNSKPKKNLSYDGLFLGLATLDIYYV